MERAELLTKIVTKACAIIKAKATLSASEYRALNLLSSRKVVSRGARSLIHKVAKEL